MFLAGNAMGSISNRGLERHELQDCCHASGLVEPTTGGATIGMPTFRIEPLIIIHLQPGICCLLFM
jgi:hypothetical protein